MCDKIELIDRWTYEICILEVLTADEPAIYV